MSLHFIGQRFRLWVSRGGCWQCGSDCRSRLAEALSFFLVAYNYEINPTTVQQTVTNDSKRMTFTIRILFGAACAWLRHVEQRINNALGPFLCPRRYQ
jgi:hypothetical protein